jgi:hypothetical protein
MERIGSPPELLRPALFPPALVLSSRDPQIVTQFSQQWRVLGSAAHQFTDHDVLAF